MCAYIGNLECDGSTGGMSSIAHGDPGNVHTDTSLQRRLASFNNWTGKKRAEDLAKAGFVYTGTSDKVVCETCGIRLYNWQEEEDPLTAHKKYGPDCDFMAKNHPQVKPVPKQRMRKTPKYQHYSDYQQRLRSFDAWPLKCVAQKPDIMARSGFFYIGSADRARCFHCGVTLRDWDTDDLPPCVHKQWSENCGFLAGLDTGALTAEIRELEEQERLKKAMENSTFININRNSASSYDRYDVVEDGVARYDVSPQVHAQATDTSSQSSGFNVSVQAVMEMGYGMDLIDQALDISRRKGDENPSARSILETIFTIEG